LISEIRLLNLTNSELAERALLIQKLAYRIEADLIGFDGIPPLHETVEDLQSSGETFLGCFVDEVLAGVISYAIEGHTLDIGRLVVHPDYFRRGIAQVLVGTVERIDPNVQHIIVSTGALNTPARSFYEKLGYKHTGDVTLPEGVTISQYEKYLDNF
jgi:GNAT superfamily N-acetyltransferase